METTNKTTEHGVHNSKIHDNAAKIVFGDSTLCAQFLKGYTDIPFFSSLLPQPVNAPAIRVHIKAAAAILFTSNL